MLNQIAESQRPLIRLIARAHTVNGYAYRICAAPLASTLLAVVSTLNAMRIKVASIRRTSQRDVVRAISGERDVEVEVEAVSPTTTQFRTVARQGASYDSATAIEIIAQTEQMLVNAN
jgi:hypothetical protein